MPLSRPSFMAKLCVLICSLIALLLSACASTHTLQARGKDLDQAIEQRDIPTALALVHNPKLYKGKDRVLYYLDAGLLHHYNSDWAKSNELLQQAEDAIQELSTKSLSKGAASLLLNDNALDYAGEDYEDLYINVFKALNYLALEERDAAFVEVRKIDDKLSYLEQKYATLAKELSQDPKAKTEIKSGKNKFHASALARYLSLMLYAAEGNIDAARIDYDNIRFAYESQSEVYPFAMPELRHPERANPEPLLRVISLVNRGPYKRAREMHIHSSQDLLLVGSVDETVQMAGIVWPDIKEGYYFKFALPYLVNRPARIAQVVAVAPDGSRYPLQKLEDLARVAQQTFEIKAPMIMFKSITRSVVKGLVAEEIKASSSEKGSSLFATLLSITADAAVFLSENADLRISRFFPAEALVAELPLPAGEHQITLEYYSSAGYLLYSELRTVKVQARAVNLLQSWCL